jgi:uncharacterized protein YbjT (DUF2867 family)
MKSREQETILVTCATGTVGSEVIKQLSSATTDFNIKAAVHSVENVKKVKVDDKVEAVQIDYNKPKTLKEAFKDVDKLFFLSRDSPMMDELAFNVVTGAKKAGIRHIVRLSAKGADMEAESPSLRLHRQSEKIIEESGIPYTILRPNEFMQNFINFHSPSIKSSNAFYMAVGDAKVSIVDVRDIAAVAVKALTENGRSYDRHIGKTYTITGPEALSYYQATEILSNIRGKKISYVNLSKEDFVRGWKEAGVDDWFIYIVSLMLDSYYRKGIASQVSSAVEEVTGKKPIMFAQFAKDYAEVFR